MPETVSLERQAWLRRRKRTGKLVYLARILLLVSFFALWELAAYVGWIEPFIVSRAYITR